MKIELKPEFRTKTYKNKQRVLCAMSVLDDELVKHVVVTFTDNAKSCKCDVELYTNDGAVFYAGALATGYGYHKPSAAFEQALAKVGVTFSESVGGGGEAIILSKMFELALELGAGEKLNVIEF